MNSKLTIIAPFLVTGLWTASALAEDSTDSPVAVQQPAVPRPDSRELDYRQLAAQMAQEDDRYRLGRTLVRVGSVAAVAGYASMYAGSRISGWTENIEWDLGTTLGFTGLALYCVGPVLSNAGAMHSAGALRRRGVGVDRQFGILGVSLLGATALLSPVIVHAYTGDEEELGILLIGAWSSVLPVVALVSSWVQMRANRRSIPGIQGLTVAPTSTRHGGGVALHASF